MTQTTVNYDQSENLPWHDKQWKRLTHDIQLLPHALLVHGQAGLGKFNFALRLAQGLLCLDRPSGAEACGHCKSCQLYACKNHPDLRIILPEQEGKAISVDTIRGLKDFLYLHAHTSKTKITIISPAEAMNINAANSLLKLLEEPPLGSIIILVSSQLSRLPLTVRSRCSALQIAVPNQSVSMLWLNKHCHSDANFSLCLQLAHGAPLRALALAAGDFLEQRQQLMSDLALLAKTGRQVVQIAAKWKNIGTRRCLLWLHGLVADSIKLSAMPTGSVSFINTDFVDAIKTWPVIKKQTQLIVFYDTISKVRDLLSTPVDELLLLEDILIRWVKLNRG